jgi:hypothetical protein
VHFPSVVLFNYLYSWIDKTRVRCRANMHTCRRDRWYQVLWTRSIVERDCLLSTCVIHLSIRCSFSSALILCVRLVSVAPELSVQSSISRGASQILFTCIVIARPLISVKWKHNRIEINNVKRTNINEYTTHLTYQLPVNDRCRTKRNT